MYTHRDLVTIELKKFADEHIKEGMKVLEVGACHEDVWFRPFFEERGCIYQSTDMRRTSEKLDYICPMEDMEGIVMSDEYDIVYSCHCFEHCENPLKALREFKRVLKKDGKLFLATPYPNKHHILEADEDHIFVLNIMQMARLLTYAGFADAISHLHYKDIPIEQDYNIISTGRKS